MVDPVLVLINDKKVSDLPDLTFDAVEEVGIDVISFRK